MTKFCTYHPTRTVSDVTTIYLSCFSSVRDGHLHWKEYARGGTGVCIGLRLLPSENLIPDPNLGRSLMEVDYDPVSWENRIARGFRNVIFEYERFLTSSNRQADRRQAREWALPALARATAMAAISTKEPKWKDEKEWRVAVVPARDGNLKTYSYHRADGTTAEYVLLPMRDSGRLLLLDEIIVGPLEDFDSAKPRAMEILEGAGYPSDDAPVPPILRSKLSSEGRR
jgi:hypothetical protein